MTTPSLAYTPDEDVKVHEEGAIQLLCKPFQSHEHGLPEWMKNAADEYMGRGAEPEERVIVLFLDHGTDNRPASIACLDFSGMSSEVIENDFRVWGDPDAAHRRRGPKGVQGGHGNGGKCYMTQMFEHHAVLHTARDGKGNRYGVEGGSIRFGYIPDKHEGRDFLVPDVQSELDNALSTIGRSFDELPPAARKAFETSGGFTLISGFGPKGYRRIPVLELLDAIQVHPQMLQTIELCEVFVLRGSTLWNGGVPLMLPAIDPMPNTDEPRRIELPETLQDPLTNQVMSTTDDARLEPGALVLRSSKTSMRVKKKMRHTIVYRAEGRSGFLGYVPVPELDIQSPYRNNIYGTCYLDALDPFKQNDRARLSNTPLSRAVEAWVGREVETYAKEFEKRDQKRYDQKERDALSKMNEALDNWKNQFLQNFMRGLWGRGNEQRLEIDRERLPSATPTRIELSLSHASAGVGVSFRPTLKFFDAEGRRVRSVPFRWVSEDNNVLMVDEDLMVINTFSLGSTGVRAETIDGKLRSNTVPLTVVRIVDIVLSPSTLDLPLGTRQRIDALCTLSDGSTTADVYLVWTESNPNVARVSPSGLVYGFSTGTTDVTAGDDFSMASTTCSLTVVPNEGKGSGTNKGPGLPRVLVSNVDTDPDTGQEVAFSHEDPPVAQRPIDVERNIWWINSSAPLARLYLDDKKEYGFESGEWRVYLLERYVDVLVQIAFLHGPTENDSMSADEWVIGWGEQVARIQEAAVSGLMEFLQTGELPS